MLSLENKKTLQRYGKNFKKWLETSKGKEEMTSHREHEKYFRQKLSQNNLSVLSEEEFGEIWKNTWASRMRTNKDWYVKNKLIAPTGLNKIRQELITLLYGSDNFIVRYDNFRQKVHGFGVSLVSEFLNMAFPEQFCLWNLTPRKVLPFLGISSVPKDLLNSSNLSGSKYQQCIDYLSSIRGELITYGVKDFIDLDLFFWYILEYVMPNTSDTIIVPNHSGNNKMDIYNIEDLIRAFDEDRNYFGHESITEKEIIEIHKKFISDFPANRISTLDIDKYVIGKIDPKTGSKDTNTFCNRLEYGLPGLGSIKGTPNDKFGIYCDKKSQEYIYDKNKYDSPESAFNSIKSQILIMLDAANKVAKDRDWKNFAQILEEGDFDIRRHVRSKILTVYFPNIFLKLHSEKAARFILEYLYKIPVEEIPEGLFLKKQKILELKNGNSITQNWSLYDYSRFIWDAMEFIQPKLNAKDNSDIKQNEITVWVVRAGGRDSKGHEENDVLESNVITIGWYEDLQIPHIMERDDLFEYIKKNRPSQNGKYPIQGISQIWSFIHEIHIGDIVILPLISKQTKFVAIGVVKGDYTYRDITPEVRHTREVKWLNKEIPINEFNQAAKKWFYLPRTVYQIENSDAINSVREVMQKYKINDGIILENPLNKESAGQNNLNHNTIENLSEELFIDEQKLKNIQQLLEEKKQIIFYGPPGTSKTFVAKKFSRYFTQNLECIEIIQFHPSYSYEDFIEGIKPRLSDEGEATGFVKQPGIFKNLVDKCIKNPDNKFVLIIDEINRGNISKIFGELIYLLEYRKDKIHLTYSPKEEFYIPENLYIIGTMNSADRSIAFVDYALRRRFYFVDFYPDEQVIKKWFVKNGIREPHQGIVLGLMRDINSEISNKLGKEYQVGYSYFMKDLDNEKVRRIIDYAIIPLIEQYFFGKKESVDQIKDVCENHLGRLLPQNIQTEKGNFNSKDLS